MARLPDFSDKLHFRYYPARSIYQRAGQAILTKSSSNGRFINARPNKAKATGWPDLQISATNCIFAIIPHDQFISGRAWPFYQREAVLSRRKQPGGQTSRFQRQIQFSLGWPDFHISATNCIFALIPHDQFISGRAKLFLAKAGPLAVLSTRGPMAVLSRAATG